MEVENLLEILLELANRTRLEVRLLSAGSMAEEFSPTRSAACRVGDRIWVVLAPDDPALRQAEVLAGALSRYRTEFLESNFLAPGVREFIEGTRGERPLR